MRTTTTARDAPRVPKIRSLLFATLCLATPSSPQAATITENFGSDPQTAGWRVFGDATLFHWNAAAGNLDVTWDSSRSNSYYYLPLGTLLNRHDDFSVAFDLKLTAVAAGVNPAKSSTFELGIGFLNIAEATGSNFLRAAHSPDLVEFDFFPDTGFGATIWPSIWSTNSSLNYNGSSDYTILDLPIDVLLRVTMAYTASNRTLMTSVTTNGISIGTIHSVSLTASFTDFLVSAFAIESYSDAGQNPQYGGSLLAHGVLDNLQINVPPPPIQGLAAAWASNGWQVVFTSRTNWLYALERTTDFQSWAAVSPATAGNGTTLALTDTNQVAALAFTA